MMKKPERNENSTENTAPATTVPETSEDEAEY